MRRYTDLPFPPYTFVPGLTPHPRSDPAGHSFGTLPAIADVLDPQRWWECRTYLHGIDLFNGPVRNSPSESVYQGFYWEAHEVWESLWLACGRKGETADFLKGLIKLAAAGVKLLEGQPRGVVGHAARAAELFRGANVGEHYLGLRIEALIETCRRVAARSEKRIVEPVFDFVLRPRLPSRKRRSRRTIMPTPWKPTRTQVAAAAGKTIADVLAPELSGVFVGINPGLYTAAIGCHFGRPGNRFWPALFAAGFTPRLLTPFEQHELLSAGWGITNLVARATATANELTAAELIEGAALLTRKMRKVRPRVVAFLGVTAYRAAFDRPGAALGMQPERLGDAAVWVLPNPSGLNAHYQLEQLAELYAVMRRAAIG